MFPILKASQLTINLVTNNSVTFYGHFFWRAFQRFVIFKMQFLDVELLVYTQEQQDILSYLATHTYRETTAQFSITSSQKLKNFLLRSVMGFTIDAAGLKGGPIPLIPDTVTKTFIEICNQRAVELNCLYTHKAVAYLEQAIAERIMRTYELCSILNCPTVCEQALDKFADTVLSPQWFNHYCKDNSIMLLNSQNLESTRRKYCHANVMAQFWAMLQTTIHQIPELLFNADETSFCANKKGKVVVPEGKFPLVEQEVRMGHITTVCTTSASGMAFRPFIILPILANLPVELRDFTLDATFATSPSGWMTGKLFYAWCAFFIAELERARISLITKYGQAALTYTAFLILDGHKSRGNVEALMFLRHHNVRVIILPAHSSHITQPFDVGLASPFKNFIWKAKGELPVYLEKKLRLCTPTARKRYLAVLTIIDAWKSTAKIATICSAWEKSGLFPLNLQRVLDSPYVRPSLPTDGAAPPVRNQVQINAMEVTTPAKLLELWRNCCKNPNLMVLPQIPDLNQMFAFLRTGHEKLLTSVGIIPIHLGIPNFFYFYI